MSGMVTLWFKVLRPLGFEIFQFFSIAPKEIAFGANMFVDMIVKRPSPYTLHAAVSVLQLKSQAYSPIVVL